MAIFFHSPIIALIKKEYHKVYVQIPTLWLPSHENYLRLFLIYVARCLLKQKGHYWTASIHNEISMVYIFSSKICQILARSVKALSLEYKIVTRHCSLSCSANRLRKLSSFIVVLISWLIRARCSLAGICGEIQMSNGFNGRWIHKQRNVEASSRLPFPVANSTKSQTGHCLFGAQIIHRLDSKLLFLFAKKNGDVFKLGLQYREV